MKLFLDANAHVPLSKAAQAAHAEFMMTDAAHGHPLSPSIAGRAAAKALEEARAKIAKLIGAEGAKNIVFTNSCTQACEWGLQMLNKTPGYCYYSPTEHPAVSQAVKASAKIPVMMDVSPNGVVIDNINDHAEATKFVCIHMQNEIGTINDIRTVRHNHPKAKIFADISQSLGKISTYVTEMGVDFAAAGGHKFGGPSGIGLLYVKNLDDWTQFGTGSRYFMDIPGTPNVAGAVMMAAALEEAINTLEERTHNMKEFRGEFEHYIEDLGFEIIGKDALRCPNTTFVKAPCNALSLMLELGGAGIHCGLGSACGSLYTGGSPLMTAIGRDGNAEDYLRFSQWGEYSGWDAHHARSAIEKIVML
jgi:cysteine desulfurase